MERLGSNVAGTRVEDCIMNILIGISSPDIPPESHPLVYKVRQPLNLPMEALNLSKGLLPPEFTSKLLDGLTDTFPGKVSV